MTTVPAAPSIPAGGALYRGHVMHRRLRPRRHRLAYRVFALLLDLDALPALDRRLRLFGHNRFALFSFHDRDHGPGEDRALRPWIEAQLSRAGIDLEGGTVRLLCYPRILGYQFNPLTVWYCHHADGSLRAILHEVHNTFGQRHSYLIPVSDPAAPVLRQSCAKGFYVSPFMTMDARYHFRLVPPGERIAVTIRQEDADGPILHAGFAGTHAPLTDRSLAAAFFRYPLMTVKIIAAIHWEALLLWRKGLRLVRRPPPPGTPVSIEPPGPVVGK